MTRPLPQRALDHLRRERLWPTLALGLGFVVLLGNIRYSDDSGMPENIFRFHKIAWRHEADIVVAGDSRAYIGISPAHLARDLPGNPRVLNFGFNAIGYHAQYRQALLDVLDPKADNPRLLLCVSPRSLTRDSISHNDGFSYTLNKA